MRMTTKSMGLSALMALMLAACGGGTVEVQGKISNETGHQPQGLSSGAPALGGQGTAEAATKVTASTVTPAGSLTVMAEATVETDHTYRLQLPEGAERVVLQAVDARGKVVASALLDAVVRAPGQSVRSAPIMSTESSLEAEVFLRMVVDGAQVESVNTVGLRSLIDTKVASRVRAEAESEREKSIAALAAAVRSAQEAEVKAYAKAGVTTTQDELFHASLDASATLDAALAAKGANVTHAYAGFFAALQQKTDKSNETQQAEAERAASASFRAVIDARLDASAGTSSTADAALRSAALLEARANDAAVKAVLKGAGATEAVVKQADDAYLALSAKLAQGSNMGSAFTEYRTALSASGQTSVLGSFLGASANAQLDAATSASAAAFTALEVSLAGLRTSLLGNLLGKVNTTALAEGVVNAYDTYHDAVRAQATAALQATAGPKTSASVEVLVVAHGHTVL